ncbi:penicillin-binding protein 2 [Candidatus Parcubacteria bacterium]|nr:penicillin-binding protein 2 [Patescibacteria group bacterium]MCG2694309.1 penicillin-binding protein 2 [Candidatus Parcubacteria bacterium]
MNKRRQRIAGDKRILILMLVVLCVAGIIVLRLFSLQILSGKKYKEIASGTHSLSTSLKADRGIIFVKELGKEDLYPVASNKVLYLVYAEPSKIQNKTLAIRALSDNLDIDEAKLKATIFKDDPYEPIAHYVSKETMEKIKEYSVAGIGFEEETKRYYPEKSFGGQILGFVGFDALEQSGRYGLEGYFNNELSGRPGYLSGEKDAFGRLIPWSDEILEEAQNGADLVLTIDRSVQAYICNRIADAVSKYDAESGMILVMNPYTGAIIGLCGSPDYNPNEYNKVKDQSVFSIPAILNQYEPGSVFKPVTVASAIDAGLISPESTYEDTGEVKVGPYTIRNSDLKANGVQTMTQVLEKSLNTGVIYIVDLLGAKKFRQYVENFGFGNLTGISLDKESTGDISSLKKSGDIWSITASYGQGILVTPLQMLNAFNALVNGGALMKPYIVEQIIYPDGNVDKIEPKIIRQVISSKTSTLISGMLASVVENGHAKQAAVEGYYVGGKTGTAQISKKGSLGYEEDKKIATFVGMAPVSNPRFSVLIRLDDPEAADWAANSAAPVFKEVTQYLLNYYHVPPER